MTKTTSSSDPVTRLTVWLAVVLAATACPADPPHGLRPRHSETCTTLPFPLLALVAYRRRRVGEQGQGRRLWRLMITGVACWIGQQAVFIGTYLQPGSVAVHG